MQALQAVPALVSSDISSIDLVSPDKMAILMVDALLGSKSIRPRRGTLVELISLL